MSQPQALTTAQLEAYSQQLANGTLADVEQVYADLYSKGYNYAGWAGGVASEDTIAGVSAVNFLTGTAMMGWGGEQCRNLPEATLDSIRMEMARQYVETLRVRSTQQGGQISEDVSYEETRQFHDDVFSNHNLSLDNWTLHTPMELVRQTQGDEAVEALWREIRDTGGDDIDGTWTSVKLYNTVGRLSFSEDPAIRDAALNWIEQVPGFANWEAIGRSVETLMEWLENTEAGRMWNAIHRIIDSDSLFLVNPLLNTAFNSARSFINRRDPLVLDLDGDGLELSAASGSVLFDHNADGIKTGTGWARPDDGLLVRDLNANGSIDSGRELFGVDTVKSNGQLASQGFDALADLDSNGDGQITSADAAWGQLQVWRDTNQDGISQTGELSGLDALGITRLGLNGSAMGPQAGQTINNNRVALSTTFTRNGVNRTVGAIDLEANGFFSEIPPQVVDEAGQPVVITQAASALPQMNGSGMVRNLRAAMSLSGTQADELEAAVAAFAAAGTRDAQLALIDNLITEWAQTSSYWSSLEGYLGGPVFLSPPAGMTGEQYRNMIGVLEVFNGSRFYAQAGSAMPVGQWSSMVNGVTSYALNPVAEQAQFLQQAYEALKESVYGALVMQTRLTPYLDAVELTVDASGVQFDTSGLDALALQGAQTDALNVIKDLMDLRRYGSEALQSVGWAFEDTMAAVLTSIDITPAVTALLAAEKLEWMGPQATSFAVSAAQAGFTVIGNALDNSITGNAAGSEYLYGGQGNDTLTAVGNWDVLDGGAGDDVLKLSNGAEQSTTFIGGAGNDTMTGGGYNDIYVFNRGDGSDTISDYGTHGTSSIYLDRLNFGEGIATSDIGARRVGVDLVVTVAGVPGDQITIKNWFNDGSGYQRIEQIGFSNGTVWTHNDLAQLALATTNTGTVGNDTISGTLHYSDRLMGGEGNDTLTAVGSWDALDGGAGDDVLRLSNGAEQSTTFIGGAGNDTMTGGGYNDIYVFNRGDGSDTITDYGTHGTSSIYLDRLNFGEGIATSDIGARRVGVDLVVTVAGVPGDQITIKNWFNDGSGYQRIEQIGFSNGTVWTHNDLAQLALATTNTGTAGNDTISGTLHYSDRLMGGEGNDTLTAVGSWDALDGGAGDDVLRLSNGAEQSTTFIGGAGNDTMTGGGYNDIYVFNRGDGSDTISDYGTHSTSSIYLDRLNFGEGIATSDIGARRVGVDLVVTVAGVPGDQITIKNWFNDGSGYQRIEQIGFSNGTVWTHNDLAQLALATTNTGTVGNDTISGTLHYSDRLMGGEGNDTLTAVGSWDALDGGAGDDVLRLSNGAEQSTTFIGGAGNDTMTGGGYNDIYVFNRGDGSDTITDYGTHGTSSIYLDRLNFGEGIATSDIGARRVGVDLVVTVAGVPGDQITIKNWFNDGSGYQRIEQIGFSNGTVWTHNDLAQLALATTNTGTAGNDTISGTLHYSDRLMGGEGNDTLTAVGSWDALDGGAGDDVLRLSNGAEQSTTFIGGAGNDTMTGGGYNDIYVFNRGDGSDTISDYGTHSTSSIYLDRLNFGEGITEEELWFSRSGNDLLVQVLGDGGQVEINDWFASPNNRIEQMQLSDGQKLLFNQVDSLVNAMAAFAPPAPGQTTLTPEQQTALAPVIAAAWN